MINLYKCNNNELNSIVDFYYNDELIYDTFDGVRVDRVLNCDYGFLIKKEDISIGFILLFNETGYYNIDIGILKRYRNKGYGSVSLSLLKQKFNNLKIEVNKNNVPCNRIMVKNKFKLSTNNTTNFYE